MAKQPEKSGTDKTPTSSAGPTPKVPGDAADRHAGDAFRADAPIGDEPANPGTDRPPAAPGVVPGVSAPSGAPTGGTTGEGGPVPSPEKGDPGRTERGTTGAPPSLATGAPQNAMGDLPRSSGRTGGTGPAGTGAVGGPADEMTVRQFAQAARDTINAALAGQWGEVIRGGGTVLTVFADVFGGGNIFGASGTLQATEEHAAVGSDLDQLATDCQRAKERVMEAQTRTRKFRMAGDHDHTTGSPPGLATDPKTFNPMVVLSIIEIVSKLIEEFRKRRNPQA